MRRGERDLRESTTFLEGPLGGDQIWWSRASRPKQRLAQATLAVSWSWASHWSASPSTAKVLVALRSSPPTSRSRGLLLSCVFLSLTASAPKTPSNLHPQKRKVPIHSSCCCSSPPPSPFSPFPPRLRSFFFPSCELFCSVFSFPSNCCSLGSSPGAHRVPTDLYSQG